MSTPTMDQLINKTRDYVEKYMEHYDPSHDYSHLLRVLQTARNIEADQRTRYPDLNMDSTIVVLSALLHDVGDRKYVAEHENATTLVRDTLLGFGASSVLADKVQLICTNVSWSSEVKSKENEKAVAEMCKQIPELAIVQDADRLDAIGATGIARYFAFSGAQCQARGLGTGHFHEKLLLLVDRMKTPLGKELAEEQTARMRVFLEWLRTEQANVEGMADEMARQEAAEGEKWKADKKKMETRGDGTTSKQEDRG